MKFNQMSLLTKQKFLPLFITQFLGAFNDNTFKNALVILITYRLAETFGFNSQILVTLAAGIFILPFFIFSATAGQLADRYEKSLLIKIIKCVEIILMIIAAIGFHFQSVTLLMFVLFMLGTHATFFGPLKYAILPEHLPEEELIAGNGLIEAGTFLSILFGTIFGGVLILLPAGEYIISSIIVLIAIGGLISSCYIPKTHSYNSQLSVSYNFIKETLQVINYSRARWDIFLSILGISWFWLVGATFLAEFPALAKDTLHANENVVTFFLTLFSLGIGVGSLLCNKLLKGKVHATYVPLGALGMTIFIIDLYFAASGPIASASLVTLQQFLLTVTGWRITVDLILIALCGGIYTVPLYAILQQRSDKAHRARVIASNNVINAFFMVLAAIITMIMLKLGFSVTQVFLMIALGNGLVAIYICKLLPDILIRGFFHWLLTSLFRVKVIGLENYYQAGDRQVIVANHTSFIDAILLATFLPEKPTFAVNTLTARKWWVKLFLRMVEAYPVDPTNPMALKSLIEYVKQDRKCVIFPEGRLTVTGALMKIYEGPGLVADKSQAKLLPIRIDGAQYTVFSRLRGKIRLRLFPKITITIFPAESLNIPAEIKGRKRRQKIGSSLFDLMHNIIFESSQRYYSQTLFSSLIDAKSVHGSNHIILEDIERIPLNYKNFLRRCFILGTVIAKKTQPGEYVGILLPNMISSVITFFALEAYSRIPAMLNYSTGINNIKVACQTAQIKTVYSSRKFIQLAKLHNMVQVIESLGIQIIYLEEVRADLCVFDKLKGIVYAQFPRLAYKFLHIGKKHQAFLKADAAAVVLFTSGSEGTPKGVVLSHKNIQANRFQLSASLDFTTTDTVLNILPLFHSFGLTSGMLLPLLSGIKTFLYPSPLHYRIIPELSYDINATILFGTDTFLAAYAKYAHLYDFYSIRYIFAGAEKLREETRTTWAQKFGIRIFEGYGATETSPVLAINTPMQNKINTVGRFLPGIQYQLEPVPGINEGGLLKVSGPNVMKGYLLANNPGVLVQPAQGWYETGDIVDIDENGFITIKGRVKRFAKIAGEMVSLVMVEEQINTLWPNNQHAVINIPCPKKNEQLVLVTTNEAASREEIVSYAKTKNLGEINIPKKIVILKKMLLLGTGKIDYVGIRDYVLANTA